MSKPAAQHAATPLLSSQDERARYVRFHRITDHGFVEFAFGVGSPELMTELVLPLEAYREFCKVNQVVYLTRAQEEAMDVDQAKWRYGTPGGERVMACHPERSEGSTRRAAHPFL